MKDFILLATNKELKLIEKLNLKNDYDVKIMGVGAFNVFKTFLNIKTKEYNKIYNIGYAGGSKIGEILDVNRVVNRGHFQNEDIDLEVFNLKSNYGEEFYEWNDYEEHERDIYEMYHEYTCSNLESNRFTYNRIRKPIVCETGDFFHTDTIQENKVYDMELWYIAKWLRKTGNLKKLIAYKVVSDNGDMKEYEKNSN